MRLVEHTWILTEALGKSPVTMEALSRCEWVAVYDVGPGQRRVVIEERDSAGVAQVRSISKDSPDGVAVTAFDNEAGVSHVSDVWASSAVGMWKRRAGLVRQRLSEAERTVLRETDRGHLLRETVREGDIIPR